MLGSGTRAVGHQKRPAQQALGSGPASQGSPQTWHLGLGMTPQTRLVQKVKTSESDHSGLVYHSAVQGEVNILLTIDRKGILCEAEKGLSQTASRCMSVRNR